MVVQRFLFLILLLISGITTPSNAQREGVTGVFMGTVTTPSGAPVSHAQVMVLSTDQALGSHLQNRHRTDQNGTFRLRLPVGQYWVKVVALGFVPHWYEDAQGRGEAVPVVISEPGVEVVWPVVVTPIASVYGHVLDASTGLPVDDGSVLIEGVVTRLHKRVALALGSFVAEGLLPGAYRIQVLAENYVVGQANVMLGVGDVLGPIPIELSKGLSISGQVVGQNGEALSDVIVTARLADRDGRLQRATTANDGTYHLSGLVPGAYIFDAHKIGFTPRFYDDQNQKEEATVIYLDNGQVYRNVNFVLGQVGAIVGRVTNAQKQPIVGARILAEPLGVGKRQQVRTNKDGQYVLADVAKGSYLVRAFADGYMPFYYDGVQTNGEATAVTVTDDAHTDQVDFVLLLGGKIAGQVRDVESNKPVGDALVSARWVGHPGIWQTQTDQNGRFELEDLPSGDFILQARARNHVTEFLGQTTDIELAKHVSVKAGKTLSDVRFALKKRQPGDFDGNGVIDFQDLMQLVHHVMDKKAYDSQFDLNKDGEIGLSDLLNVTPERAGKMATEQGALRWQQVEDDPQVLVAELLVDNLPLAKGYVLQVNYDADLAELLGAKETETGVFAGHPLLVQRQHGTVLIALEGHDVASTEAQGSLVQLRFRLKGDATGVPIEIATALLFGQDDQLVPLRLPAKFDLELPPQTFRLMQNSPNPFNPATTIAFELPQSADVDVAVYNLVGQRLRTLVRENKAPGRYQVVWDGKDDSGRDVSSGVYFYRYHAGEFWASRRMLLIR
jgi:hypothetical protein